MRKRKIEVFTSGCPLCEEVIEMIRKNLCQACELIVLDMHEMAVSERARNLGVKSVPSVVIDGELVKCCSRAGVDLEIIKGYGLGEST